jgi:hypothetical protein
MAEFPETFNAEEIPEDDRNFDPVPAGNYQMQVIESSIEDTKSGTGQMLVLVEEIIDGQYQGRRIYDRLNIQNENPDAQRIAQRALADLCLQIGISQIDNSEDLHFKPFIGKVTITTDKSGQYGPQNRVRYNYTGDNQRQPPAGKAPAQRQAQRPAQGQTRTGANTRPANQASRGAPQGQRPAKPWANSSKGKGQEDPPF